jgi:hypothetical protein
LQPVGVTDEENRNIKKNICMTRAKSVLISFRGEAMTGYSKGTPIYMTFLLPFFLNP